jgi:hypothetical protein
MSSKRAPNTSRLAPTSLSQLRSLSDTSWGDSAGVPDETLAPGSTNHLVRFLIVAPAARVTVAPEIVLRPRTLTLSG